MDEMLSPTSSYADVARASRGLLARMHERLRWSLQAQPTTPASADGCTADQGETVRAHAEADADAEAALAAHLGDECASEPQSSVSAIALASEAEHPPNAWPPSPVVVDAEAPDSAPAIGEEARAPPLAEPVQVPAETANTRARGHDDADGDGDGDGDDNSEPTTQPAEQRVVPAFLLPLPLPPPKARAPTNRTPASARPVVLAAAARPTRATASPRKRPAGSCSLPPLHTRSQLQQQQQQQQQQRSRPRAHTLQQPLASSARPGPCRCDDAPDDAVGRFTARCDELLRALRSEQAARTALDRDAARRSLVVLLPFLHARR